MRVDRLTRRIDAASTQVIDLRHRFGQLEQADREGVAGDIARLYELVDRILTLEREARDWLAAYSEEQAAHELERRRCQELLDLVPVATLLTTPTAVIQQANRVAGDLFGDPPDRLIGSPLAAFVADRTALESLLGSISKVKQPSSGPRAFEERFIARGRRAFTARVTVSAVCGPVGEVAGLQWSIQRTDDATAPPNLGEHRPPRKVKAIPTGDPVRKRVARQPLVVDPEAAAAYYRTLFDGAPDAIIVFDLSRHLLDANRVAHDVLGFADDEIEGLRLDDLTVCDTERLDAVMVGLRRDGSWRGDLELRRKGGDIVPVEAAIATGTSPVGVICRAVLRGISDDRREQVERVREQRELVGMIGHELMTPLNNILLHAELIKMQEGYRASSVDAILSSVRREQRLIDDLLDVARTDVMHLRVQLAYVDLLPILRSCIADVQTGTKMPALRLDAPSELPPGYWDSGRLREVFDNLVENAVKFSPGDSEIRLSVEDLGDRVHVAVIDQGVGIDAAALPHVFDRYFQAGPRKDGRRGLGLGLYIVKTLVESHGGTITAESVVDAGSVFHVTLPYAPEGAPGRSASTADVPWSVLEMPRADGQIRGRSRPHAFR